MSWVSNAIVLFGYEKNIREKLETVNNKLEELDHRKQQFVESTDTHNWYGGSKFMEATVWAAAFNHIYLESVYEALLSVEWTSPEELKLLWKDEEDDGWKVITQSDMSIYDRT